MGRAARVLYRRFPPRLVEGARRGGETLVNRNRRFLGRNTHAPIAASSSCGRCRAQRGRRSAAAQQFRRASNHRAVQGGGTSRSWRACRRVLTHLKQRFSSRPPRRRDTSAKRGRAAPADGHYLFVNNPLPSTHSSEGPAVRRREDSSRGRSPRPIARAVAFKGLGGEFKQFLALAAEGRPHVVRVLRNGSPASRLAAARLHSDYSRPYKGVPRPDHAMGGRCRPAHRPRRAVTQVTAGKMWSASPRQPVRHSRCDDVKEEAARRACRARGSASGRRQAARCRRTLPPRSSGRCATRGEGKARHGGATYGTSIADSRS